MTDQLKAARDALDSAHHCLGEAPCGEMNTAVEHVVTAVCAVLAHLRAAVPGSPALATTPPMTDDERRQALERLRQFRDADRWQVLKRVTWFQAEQDEVTAYVESLRRQLRNAELLLAASRIREAGGIEPVRLGEGHLDPHERSNKDSNE